MAKKKINGVVVDAESIVTSLQIIKTVCEDNVTDCEKCPFYDDNEDICCIADSRPSDWKITDCEPTWRALK